MNFKKIIIGLAIIVLGFFVFAKLNKKYGLVTFDPIKAKKEANLILINVLDKNLYDDCHIKGSINVPFDQFENYAEKLKKYEQERRNNLDHIVVYCSNYMCTASGIAAKMLINKGLKNVWAYEAGMAGWYQAGFAVEGSCAQGYIKAENKKPEQELYEIPVITTEELKNKIDKFGILEPKNI